MSTDNYRRVRFTGRALVFGVVLGAVGLGLRPGASAADFAFNPTLELFVFQDGNPNVVGEDPVSQDVVRGQLGLEFATLTPRTKWDLNYQLYHEHYRDEDVLDNTGHVLYSNLDHDFSRRSDMKLRFFAARTERQRIRREIIDQPDSLVPRTFINRVSLSADGRVYTGSRDFVRWIVGGGLARYDERPGVEYNDWNQGLIGAGWGRDVSRRVNVGLAYVFRHIDYENTPSLDTNTLAVTTGYEIGEKTKLDGAVGVVRADRADGESDSTLSLSVGVRQELDRFNDLRCGVRRIVTPGFGIGGATLDEGGYAGWRFRRSRLWWLDINATYWRRELLGAEGSGTEGFRTLSSVWWTPWKYLSFSLFHSYTNQNNLGSSTGTAYNTGGLLVRWEILGNTYGGLRRGR